MAEKSACVGARRRVHHMPARRAGGPSPKRDTGPSMRSSGQSANTVAMAAVVWVMVVVVVELVAVVGGWNRVHMECVPDCPFKNRRFYGCFLVIEARGRIYIQSSVSYCRAEPFKVSAAAPRPRKKDRFGVAIADRPLRPPWAPRLPEIGTGARTSQYTRGEGLTPESRQINK